MPLERQNCPSKNLSFGDRRRSGNSTYFEGAARGPRLCRRDTSQQQPTSSSSEFRPWALVRLAHASVAACADPKKILWRSRRTGAGSCDPVRLRWRLSARGVGCSSFGIRDRGRAGVHSFSVLWLLSAPLCRSSRTLISPRKFRGAYAPRFQSTSPKRVGNHLEHGLCQRPAGTFCTVKLTT
jgi:hypothetical protein